MRRVGPCLAALRSAAATFASATALVSSTPAVAQDPVAANDAQASPFAFHGRVEWLTAAGTIVPRDTSVNPDNLVLHLPQAAGSSELRPDLRLDAWRDLRAVVRPRLLTEITRARAGGTWQPSRTGSEVEWLDVYVGWQANDRVALTYGLQNYQWGPGELVSPSNRIFHETGFARDPLYVVHGKHLARVNLSAGRSWSAVVLAEVGANDDRPFVAGEPFERKGQAKLEWSDEGGRGWIGLTFGAGRTSGGFFGEYGSLAIGEGFSIYADAVHQLGSRAWYPVDDGANGARFEQSAADAGLRTLALGGIRYTFEGGTDLRLEYVFDEAGWDTAQLRLAERAAAGTPTSPPAPQTVMRWLDPGFEIAGRRHAYASLAFSDLPPRKRTTVALRYLLALEDLSGAAFATASWAAADWAVIFATATATHGDDHGALSRLARGTALAGATISW